MNAAKLCQLHKTFEQEWRRDFPNGPRPELKEIDDIIQHELTETSFADLISSVQERLVASDHNIDNICEQIHRELVIKQFLIRVLEIVDPSKDLAAQLFTVCSQLLIINNWNSSVLSNYILQNQPDIGKVSESKFSDSELCKLISNVGENKHTYCSTTLPRQCYTSNAEKGYNGNKDYLKKDSDSLSCSNLANSSEYDAMFKRKKNIAKPNDGDSGSHILGAKDNFLGVKSKHITSTISRQTEGTTSSPQLTRNFQFLKLTDGFDLVLGDSLEDKRNKNGREQGRPKCDITTGGSHYQDKSPGSTEIINVKCGDSSEVFVSSKINKNISTILIRKPGSGRQGGGEGGSGGEIVLVDDCVIESEVRPPKQTCVEESSPVVCQPLYTNSGDCGGNTSQQGLHFTPYDRHDEHSQSFQNSLRKFSNKCAAVPPPVPKKPFRAGSGKKVAPFEVEEEGLYDGAFLSCDSINSVKTQASLIATSNRCSQALSCSNSVDGIDRTYQNASLRKIGGTGSNHLLVEHTTKVVQNPETKLTVTDHSSESLSLQDKKTVSFVVPNVLETAIDEVIVSETEMSFYRLHKMSDNSEKRNSVGGLVEGIGFSFRNSHIQVEECETTVNSDDLASSKYSISLPDIPHRMPINANNDSEAAVCESENIGDMKNNDCQILVTSSSTDADDSKVGSHEHSTSNNDSKDVVQSQENVGQSEQTDTGELSPETQKRLSSTSGYENWTINRAITTPTRVYYSVSDDDELDDIPTSPIAVGPYNEQQDFSSGSKDSGLCDDISTSEVSPVETHSDSDIASGHGPDNITVLQGEHLKDDTNQSLRGSVSQEKGLNSEAVSEHVHGQSPRQRREEDVTESLSVDRISVDTLSVHSDEEASTNMDSSYDENDSARDGMLKMRQLLVKGVLDSEKGYLLILTLLIDYKRSLEASSMSSQPVISKEDINTIFSNIEHVNEIHTEFVNSLEAKVVNWTHGETIGEIFKIMISKLINFSNYLNNYQLAVSTIHKCCQESEQFAHIAKHIKVNSTMKQITVNSTMKETTSLEDALFKPVQRVQRNTLVLHDLIKYTPEDHPDYHSLQKALKLSQHIIETFAIRIPQNTNTQENRRLVKSSFLVENVGGVRKLRYIFLFSDVLVCTKRETRRSNKISFDIKWFAPLSHSSIDTRFSYSEDNKSSTKDDVSELKGKLKGLKRELKFEMRKSDDKDRHRTLVSLGGGVSRNVEKLKKKINQTEAQLILSSPKLPFKVLIEGGRLYTLLMSTDYEREEWKETIASLCKKFSRNDQSAQQMSSIYIQELVNSVKETPQVNKIGNVLLQKDEDMLTGILNVTIHKVNGLTEACDTYCNMEMDSFGHFFFKAKTTICERTQDPAWNEDFDLELEGSETLRILCFKKEPGGQGDTLLGRGALELSRKWMKGSFQEKTLSMNEVSLVISVRNIPADKTMQRTPSRTSSAVFGVSLSSCAKREGKTVPMIVTACVQEVEKRGIDEVGIYRVSGVSSDLQNIKKLIDKNSRAGVLILQDADIHSVTGVLKLYLRELPEPLFTEASYQSFIDTLKLSDEEAKAQCMLALLHGLPDTNYYTAVYLLEHIIKVAKKVGVNKMSIQNLSTVFGPTLLAPATKQESTSPLEMMYKGAEEVMQQSNILNYLLGLAFSGKSLWRSAQ